MKATYLISSLSKNIVRGLAVIAVVVGMSAGSVRATSTEPAIVIAQKIAATVTGGTMPPSDPAFAQVQAKVQLQDYYGAAMAAIGSQYFSSYPARRLARQMMNSTLNASSVTDSDAVAFVIANFVGGATWKRSISKLWSDNATYLVQPTTAGSQPVHILSLTPEQMAAIDFRTQLVRVEGQQAVDGTPANSAGANQNSTVPTTTTQMITIAPADVGGYTTLSDRLGDTSLASFGLNAGTNLRMIESIWEISTGMQLVDFEDGNMANAAQLAPRFVPGNDPNFVHGVGQPACIECHAGGLSSLFHGYQTVADVFDYNPDAKNSVGFVYRGTPGVSGTTSTPYTNLRKTLGSSVGGRVNVSDCKNIVSVVCNPDAPTNPSSAWDLTSVWSGNGILGKLGWNGPTSGTGLNSLGAAIGQANIIYQNMTNRVVNEICPLSSIAETQIQAIAAAAQKADDIQVIVAMVASDPSCY